MLGWFIIERVDVNFQMNVADTAVAIMCSLLHKYLELNLFFLFKKTESMPESLNVTGCDTPPLRGTDLHY